MCSRPPRSGPTAPPGRQLRKDEAITEADTLLLTVPNQLGVAYNAHVIETILNQKQQLAVSWCPACDGAQTLA